MKDKNKIVNKLKHSIQIYYLYTNVLFFKIKNERKQDIKRQKSKGTKVQRNAKNKAKNTNKGKIQETKAKNTNKGKKHKQMQKHIQC